MRAGTGMCQFLVITLFSAMVSRGAHGQRFTDALVGSRVRLDLAAGSLITGTVVGLEADTIRLMPSGVGTAVAVARTNVLSYELSAGRARARGARRGAIVGGALGLAVLVASLRSDTATINRRPSDLGVAVPLSVGLVALGAGIGAAAAPERWESPTRISLNERTRFIACPGQCVALQFGLGRPRRTRGVAF
jgi:hypothetical protein